MKPGVTSFPAASITVGPGYPAAAAFHGGDDAALYRHVSGKTGGSGAVYDGAAPDQQISMVTAPPSGVK